MTQCEKSIEVGSLLWIAGLNEIENDNEYNRKDEKHDPQKNMGTDK